MNRGAKERKGTIKGLKSERSEEKERDLRKIKNKETTKRWTNEWEAQQEDGLTNEKDYKKMD